MFPIVHYSRTGVKYISPLPIYPPEHPAHVAPLRKMGRPPRPGEFMHVVGNFSGVKQAREAMGIDWMSRDELREAILPAYSEFIAKQFLTQTPIVTKP